MQPAPWLAFLEFGILSLGFSLMNPLSDIIFISTYSLLACALTFIAAPFFIRFLHRHKIGKQIRDVASDGRLAPIFNALHLKKTGTPTMGGVLIWGVTFLVVGLSRFLALIGVLDKSLLQRKETYLPLATLLATAVLGAVDDMFNIRGYGKAKGIDVKPKFFWLLLFAIGGSWWFYSKLGYDTINLPFVGDFFIGLFYVPLFILVIISSAHAVNITDGLDGLAGGLLAIAFTAFGIISYAMGLIWLTAFCGVIIGTLIAFLWFNVSPAKFYMGDTGALSLGSTLGVIAMLTDSIVPFVIIGGVFVAETLSVMLQLTSKRLRDGKKIFQIAPLHHHFEAIGWPEHNVVFRFWIIGALLAVVGVVVKLAAM
jgi:phospho-N-acetylmuramoyl-pentapeptide-transferase